MASYYVTCEALTNAVKHGKASCVRIQVECTESVLTLSIRDDGIGGADRSRGSGLIGLVDRVEAAGGTIAIESPPGRGTSIAVQLPLARSHRRLGVNRGGQRSLRARKEETIG